MVVAENGGTLTGINSRRIKARPANHFRRAMWRRAAPVGFAMGKVFSFPSGVRLVKSPPKWRLVEGVKLLSPDKRGRSGAASSAALE